MRGGALGHSRAASTADSASAKRCASEPMIASLSISPECQRKAISFIAHALPPRIW
jgi:hypothetical protein